MKKNQYTIKKTIFILFLSIVFNVTAQSKIATKILNEGKLLYRLEKGSWYGTDHFLEKLTHKKDSIGGYLSYETENGKINTIFFNRYNPTKLLVRYQFDYIPKQQPILIDTINLNITEIEKNLNQIRQDALKRVYKNETKFFKFYNDSNLNFIPLITKKQKRVFILTGTTKSGITLIGNDYILNYGKNNVYKSKIKLHNSILEFAFKANNDKQNYVSTIHSHVVTKYITSTDICTLLLYKDYFEWKQHIVIHKKYVSIFDLESETLVFMKYKVWKNLSKSK